MEPIKTPRGKGPTKGWVTGRKRKEGSHQREKKKRTFPDDGKALNTTMVGPGGNKKKTLETEGGQLCARGFRTTGHLKPLKSWGGGEGIVVPSPLSQT